ncbi:MAG: SDR family NAD(P)-dependent oxidoreductase [Anaerolineae bacterium]|nr:SDR family NAD(P)-dependent oxidoreductase [Anaerolineae bacterium]
MAKYLVTGGAGFIGSHIAHALVARGDSVRVLDNFSSGNAANLSHLNGQVDVITGDICSQETVAAAMADIDYVFHEAAFVSVPLSLQQPQTCFDINIQGTTNILEAAAKSGVRRVVLASSAAVYGDSQALPLEEDTALNSLSPYAASKRTNEIFAGLYTQAFGLPVVALRYFNVFGPRQSPNSDYAAAIPIFIQKLLAGQTPTVFGDGGQSRDFVFIEDVVRANLLAAEAPHAPGQVFNVCSGQATSLLQLLTTLNNVMGSTIQPDFAPPRPGDIYHSVGDPRRAAATLGFTASIPLAAGLQQTLAWMQA